ncbi:hypothetical protein Ahy_B10g104363 [Arachis hypogaea]|uniref:DUF4283 domain-containing protein n=1 Tax=Arachis hypogaea TaxID=3818 RepID=A0A444X5A0_ARAHY|nr:hypothetical protein Ahy_B10g104363 [Arachis hypogaea]
MRGSYSREGHFRVHEPSSSKCMRKIRVEGGKAEFSGKKSLLSREEEWMREESENMDKRETPVRSFSDMVKGGRRPTGMEEDDSFSESGEEGEEEHNMQQEREVANQRKDKDETQEPNIRIEKVDGVYNIVLNDAAIKSLRNPWWECLIVKLLGRRISLAALTRKLEIMWSRMGSIEVIDLAAIIPTMAEGRTEETLHGHNNGEGSHGNSEKNKGKKVSIEDNSTYGSWMQVQCPTCGKKVGRIGASTSSGSGAANAKEAEATMTGTRFSVLNQIENDTLNDNSVRISNEKENEIIPENSQNQKATTSQKKEDHLAQPSSLSKTPKESHNKTTTKSAPMCEVLPQPKNANTGPIRTVNPTKPNPTHPNNDPSFHPSTERTRTPTSTPLLHHHRENLCDPQLTSQDTTMEDSFVEESAQIEDIREE